MPTVPLYSLYDNSLKPYDLMRRKQMATARKVKSKFTPDDLRKALAILQEAGQEGGYAYESVLELLPPEERPPVRSSGSVAILITEIASNSEAIYSQADWKKIKTAILTDWKPLTVELGKKGTLHLEVDASEDHPLDW
jgi:hypothetical protein